MRENTYSISNLRFSYDASRPPFDMRIDRLDVAAGDIVALVGPNGSGKTTLLMLLAFLLDPREGRIEFFGGNPRADGERIRQARRQAVLVTHNPYLFKGSVGDNLAYGLRIRGVPQADWPGRISEALAYVELDGWERRPVATLSAGQIQRVALARATVLRPRVLLLDEPTANIETGLGYRVEAVIREFSRVKGTTVVFSTHNYSQASRLADEVLFLSGGRRVPFSHENCFSGVSGNDGLKSWIEPRPGVRIHFPGIYEGHMTCLINPERIQILPGGGAEVRGASNVFAGRIARLETTEGDLALVRISGDLTFRATIPLPELDRLGVSLSSNVLLRFSPEAVEVVGNPGVEDSQ